MFPLFHLSYCNAFARNIYAVTSFSLIALPVLLVHARKTQLIAENLTLNFLKSEIDFTNTQTFEFF